MRYDDGYRGLVYDDDDTGMYAPNRKEARVLERRLGVGEDVREVRRRKRRGYNLRRRMRSGRRGGEGSGVGDEEGGGTFGVLGEGELSSGDGEACVGAFRASGVGAGRDSRKRVYGLIGDADEGGLFDSKKKKAKSNGVFSVVEQEPEEQVYCICRKPEEGRFMVACDGPCDDWYHGSCVGVTAKEALKMDKYFCEYCAFVSCIPALTTTLGKTCSATSTNKGEHVGRWELNIAITSKTSESTVTQELKPAATTASSTGLGATIAQARGSLASVATANPAKSVLSQELKAQSTAISMATQKTPFVQQFQASISRGAGPNEFNFWSFDNIRKEDST